jgi:RNA polymerase sigma-70 factor (ECF subfamily)
MADSILQDIAAGKSGSVDACLRRYAAAVWRLARRMSASEHDAEDAVQEIFLEVWRSAARYDASVASELTFVLTIARRRLIDRARRSRNAPRASGADAVETLVADPALAGASAELSEDAARVAAAMAKLRPEQRSVLEMAFFAGQTHHQISAETGMPLGTVKTHARRGLRRVRELLGLDPDSPKLNPGDASAAAPLHEGPEP